MSSIDIVSLAFAFCLIAGLYSAVGHAGASGYLAAMALLGVAPATMRPTALALNLLVAAVATWRWHGKGLTPWRTVAALAVGSVPAAYFAGAYPLTDQAYRLIVGGVLALSALFVMWSARSADSDTALAQSAGSATRTHWSAVPAGAAIGALAGFTGTGGGIFLSPLLLALGWRDLRRTAAVVAPFILLNSAAGLAGNVSLVGALPGALGGWLIAVAVGGWVGSRLGADRLSQRTLRVLLAVVMLIAALKLLLN